MNMGEVTAITVGGVCVTSIDIDGVRVWSVDSGLSEYSVTLELTGCSADNTITSVAAGDAYTVKLTCPVGYTFDYVRVIMGGEDVTGSIWSQTGSRNGRISIPSVSGNVIVTAMAYN